MILSFLKGKALNISIGLNVALAVSVWALSKLYIAEITENELLSNSIDSLKIANEEIRDINKIEKDTADKYFIQSKANKSKNEELKRRIAALSSSCVNGERKNVEETSSDRVSDITGLLCEAGIADPGLCEKGKESTEVSN